MKQLRVFVNLTLAIVLGAVVLASPAPAMAVSGQSIVFAEEAQLVVENRTGGTLYVRLSGPKNYYFNTDKKAATFKDIERGKYTITVTSSACSGSLSYQKNLNGNTTLKGFKCVAQRLGTVDQKVADLTVDNRTGGTLYISLKGPANYNFSTSKNGKTTFKDILPGKYEITVRSSACSGSLTYNRKLEGKVSLKQFYCSN